MAADRPYGEFYDFYSVSPEYFGYHHVYELPLLPNNIASETLFYTHQERCEAKTGYLSPRRRPGGDWQIRYIGKNVLVLFSNKQ
jgi:hypothetical protein